jgi:hypothetical protein
MVNGINRRGEEVLQTIRDASWQAAKEGCAALFVLGDLFDHTRPTPQLVRATADALTAGSIPVVVLLGNHDMQSDGEHDHACASLELSSNILVISKPTLIRYQGIEVVCAPYRPGNAYEWLPDSIARACLGAGDKLAQRFLVTHLGIWDDATPPYLKAARDAVGIGQMRWLCDAHGINVALAGNWHARKVWPSVDKSPLVIIPGTLCPAGFQEPDQDLVGKMFVVDDAGMSRCYDVPGPRWYTLDGLAEIDQWLIESHSPSVYARVRLTAAEAATNPFAEIPDNLYVTIEVKPGSDEVSIVEAAREAVAAGEGALASFADLVTVSPPGTTEGVLNRLQAFRKSAG